MTTTCIASHCALAFAHEGPHNFVGRPFVPTYTIPELTAGTYVVGFEGLDGFDAEVLSIDEDARTFTAVAEEGDPDQDAVTLPYSAADYDGRRGWIVNFDAEVGA